MEHNLTLGRRIADALAMFVVAAVSLFILVYVAFGEARRNHERFQIEKLISQGQVAQSLLETFVRPGLPMHQFVGFSQMTEPLVEADPLIDGIAAYNATGERVFAVSGGTEIPLLPITGAWKTEDGIAEIRTDANILQVVLPVRNRFETVGSIVLSSPRDKIHAQVEKAFKPLVFMAAFAALVFVGYVSLFGQHIAPDRRTRMVAIAFALQFVFVSVFVVSTLLSIYSQGAQARAKAIADSVSQRLDDVVFYGLNFDDLTGIIALVDEYKRLNPEIRAVALMIDGKIRAHSAPVPKSGRWEPEGNDFEYTVPLSSGSESSKIEIVVAMPKDVVYKQVLRSGKNFLALFVASAFIAALFMGVARSLQYVSRTVGEMNPIEREKATLNLVKPVFFLAVFVEHLTYAFLPQLMHEIAAGAKLSTGYASLPFLAYYACFAFSLIPAGRLNGRLGSRTLIIVGLAMAAGGIGLMAFMTNFETAIAARALAGLGQGTLFIGVQSYVLANSSPSRKTQAGSAIVFGFQAGMIAGMAIGSLLVTYIGAVGIFHLGCVLALTTMLYAVAVLPYSRDATLAAASTGTAWGDVGRMLRATSFLKSMLLVGVPAKAVLTGVILFGLPMLLSGQGFEKEDIGQVTMIYAGAVILASSLMSSYADRTRLTERVLVIGGLLTAVGLMCMSLIGLEFLKIGTTNSPLSTSIIVIGVTIVGFAHGCINAPVVTHVAESQIANELGAANVASTYRLVERFGHMLGPVIMGQIFLHTGVSWAALGWVGIAVLVLTVLFPSSAEPIHHNERKNAVA